MSARQSASIWNRRKSSSGAALGSSRSRCSGDRARRLTAREVIAILRRHGFILVTTRGSHQKWRNPEKRRQVIVAEHRGKALPIGTLTAIRKGSSIPDEEWL